MSTSFNKSESLRDLLRCLLDGSIDGEAGRVVLDVIDELDCLPLTVEPPSIVETPVDAAEVEAGSMGRLVWYGSEGDAWLGREAKPDWMSAYFSLFWSTPGARSVAYYPCGNQGESERKALDFAEASAVAEAWATELGFTVDPCPFIKETPVVEPVGSDLDQLFAAFLAWRRSSRGKQHRLANLVLYDDGSGRLSTAGEQYLMEWCDHKEGAVSINSLIDNS